MKNFTSKNNHGVFKAFFFPLLCSGNGFTDEPSTDSEQVNKAIEAIKALGGEVSLDESGNVDAVDLSRSKTTDADLLHVAKLEKLQRLFLYSTKISDAGLVHLESLTSLDLLYLGDTNINDAGLVHLKGLTSLTRLDLTKTKVSDAGVKKLQESLPKCKITRAF